MNLLALRDHAVAAIERAVPATLLRTIKVDSHPGRFELAEIEKYAASAPCIRVSIISATDKDLSEPTVDVELAAYVLTKNGKAGLADAQGLVLCSLVLALLRRPDLLEAESASSPRAVVCRSLYNAEIGNDGIALHAVSWKQTLTLPDLPEPAELGRFEQLFATTDFGPTPDGRAEATDSIRLEGA